MGDQYVYRPLRELGHEVVWYDTVDSEEGFGGHGSYSKLVESFKPDLIFCCFTGNRHITPREPWEEVMRETETGRTKTFNWFCDDTWRFESFSSKTCGYFNVCSTPEPDYLQKYHSIGYKNIILGCWHANSKSFPLVSFENKDIDISFVGNLTPGRKQFFDMCQVPVKNVFGIPTEELFSVHSKTKIGVNLSVNDNDPYRKTQMKQRMFEIPAGQGLLVTQHHDGIENFYDIDKEIVTFKTIDEFNKKINFLSKNPKVVEKMAKNGHRRFIREHDSEVRLRKVLEKIEEF